MFTPLDYGNFGYQTFTFLLSMFILKRVAPWKDPNPIAYSNFSIVLADCFQLFFYILHDYSVRVFEAETFGDFGIWLFLSFLNVKYWYQVLVFYVLPILHLLAIFKPGSYRQIGTKASILILMVPLSLSFVLQGVYLVICDCSVYVIPGYYVGLKPGKEAIYTVWYILDMTIKGPMFVLLIVVDLILICRLYKMKILGKKNVKTVQEANNSTTQTQPNGSKIDLPRARIIQKPQPYVTAVIYNIELTKCTIYVLIVTLK
ncbi:unnamed protein product, partial [Mesorhabditis spiculigera]